MNKTQLIWLSWGLAKLLNREETSLICDLVEAGELTMLQALNMDRAALMTELFNHKLIEDRRKNGSRLRDRQIIDLNTLRGSI